MKRTGLCVILLMAAGWASAGPSADETAAGLAESSMGMDPDLLKEVQQAEESDLDAALSRALADSKVAASNLQALMAGARETLQAVLADLPPSLQKTEDPEPGSVEDAVDQVLLSSQMLEAKGQEFVKKAAKAGLDVGSPEEEEIRRRRRTYRPHDRRRDLRISEKYLQDAESRFAKLKKKKKKPLELGEDAREALAAGDSFLAEVRSGRGALVGLVDKLKAGPGGGIAVKRLELHLVALVNDVSSLELERNMLETTMKLVLHEAGSFDRTQ